MVIIDLFKSIESAAKNPTEADFLDLLRQLDQSIESATQLPAAGDAIEQLAAIYSDRANAKFDEIEWLKSPQNEPIVPLSEFDKYIRQSCALDLDRFMLDQEHYEGYKGLHIYFKNKSNFYFPWKLQIWDTEDIQSNIQNHEKFKRNFI